MTELKHTAPKHERMLDPEPAFLRERVDALQAGAASGELAGRELRFSAGIETEFTLFDPAKFRDAIDVNSPNRLAHSSDGLQLEVDMIARDELIDTLQPRKFTDERLRQERASIREFVGALVPKNHDEHTKQQEWLDQIENFELSDLINFQLYKEFSTPTLSTPTMPKGASYDELEAASNQAGWLEFRFGKGSFQTGYYDDTGISEMRVAPCPPTEAIERHSIIVDRLAEIAADYGSLLSVRGSHINVGVYGRDENGALMPLIGNDENRRKDTLDINAGLAAAVQDMVWLSQKNMRYGFMSIKSNTTQFKFGPTRGDIRIQDDYLELRSNQSFQTIAHGLNWLMAGAVMGVAGGAERLQSMGYKVPETNFIYHVKRQDGFDKDHDLFVQRAFENSEPKDGKFALEMGFNAIFPTRIANALIGNIEKPHEGFGSGYFNDAVFGATIVGENGKLFCDINLVEAAISEIPEETRIKVIKGWFANGYDATIQAVNAQLAKIRLDEAMVVRGTIITDGMDPEATIKRIKESPTAELAYGDKRDEYLQWIDSRRNTLFII